MKQTNKSCISSGCSCGFPSFEVWWHSFILFIVLHLFFRNNLKAPAWRFSPTNFIFHCTRLLIFTQAGRKGRKHIYSHSSYFYLSQATTHYNTKWMAAGVSNPFNVMIREVAFLLLCNPENKINLKPPVLSRHTEAVVFRTEARDKIIISGSRHRYTPSPRYPHHHHLLRG